MAVPDADPNNLEQLPPASAEQPVGAASLLPAAAERQEDICMPDAGQGPPVGAAAKDNALPDPEQGESHSIAQSTACLSLASSAMEPVCAASLLLEAAERQEDICMPDASHGPPVGVVTKDNVLPEAEECELLVQRSAHSPPSLPHWAHAATGRMQLPAASLSRVVNSCSHTWYQLL